MLWTGAGAPNVSAADARLRLVERPVDVRAGDRAQVVAEVERVAACRLVLRLDAAAASTRSVPAAAPADGRSRITWRWRVPARTGPADFGGAVRCWRTPLPRAGRSPRPDVERAFAGRLHGPGRRGRLVDRGGLSAVVVTPAPDDRPWLQKASDWAALIGIAVGFFGLGGVLISLRAARRQAQSERTQRILDRYGEMAFIEMWLRVQSLLTARDEAEAVEQIRRLEGAVTNVDPIEPYVPPPETPGPVPTAPTVRIFEADTCANFFEEIAALSNAGKLDDRLVIGSFGPIMPQALQMSWWWIHYRRGGRRAAARVPVVRDGEIDMYSEWERMVRTLARHYPDMQTREFTRQEGLKDSKRALCLPPREPRCADADQWDAFKQLSLAVGTLVAQEGGAQRLRELLGDAPPLPAPKDRARVVLLPEWRTYLREPGPIARRLLTLGARLSCGGPSWLRVAGAAIADREARVAHHRRLHETADLLTRRISGSSPDERLQRVGETLQRVRGAQRPGG